MPAPDRLTDRQVEQATGKKASKLLMCAIGSGIYVRGSQPGWWDRIDSEDDGASVGVATSEQLHLDN